jgi:hypothetical protein
VVLAQHRSYAAARTTVTLEERGNVDGVELHLGTGGAVRGIVVKDRQPLFNVTVVATGQDGSTKTATTAADGSYRIDSLGAGSYQLVVLPLTGGTLDLTGGASATIEIVEGQEIVHNFGGGPKLIGTCAPPPPPVFMLIGGAAVLRPPGPPLMQAGGDIPMDQLLRNQYAPIDTLGQFTIQDVTQGDWQVEIYYPSGGRGLLRLVAVEPVSFQGNDDMRVNITVSTAQ